MKRTRKKASVPQQVPPLSAGFSYAKYHFGSRLEDKGRLGFWLDGRPVTALVVIDKMKLESALNDKG